VIGQGITPGVVSPTLRLLLARAAPLADLRDFVSADVQELEELLMLLGRVLLELTCHRFMASSENPAAFMIDTHLSFVII